VPQRRFVLPPDATEVVLLRHGASIPAVEGQPFPLLDGHDDPPLAPAGEEQAKLAAQRLARDAPSALFVSGLTRTVQTAAPLVALTGLDTQIVGELREVMLGDWQGGEFRIRMAAGDPLAMRVLAEERWDVIPNAEPGDEFAARVRAGIEKVVVATGPGRMAVAVVHGGVIAEACRQATSSRPFAFVHVDNCSITRIVVFGDGRWLLRAFNETAHLDRTSGDARGAA
jgi:probable phosphoglycerate mutase